MAHSPRPLVEVRVDPVNDLLTIRSNDLLPVQLCVLDAVGHTLVTHSFLSSASIRTDA